MRALSAREVAFVEAYMGAANGNVTKAAIAAGYSRKTAASIGSRLLKRVNVRAAIDARVAADPKVADRAERQQFYTRVMRDPKVSMKERLKAAELQGKTQGDFVLRVEHSLAPMFSLPDGIGVSVSPEMGS